MHIQTTSHEKARTYLFLFYCVEIQTMYLLPHESFSTQFTVLARLQATQLSPLSTSQTVFSSDSESLCPLEQKSPTLAFETENE